MPIKHETSTRFTDEISIIPRVAYVISGIGFLLPWAAVTFALTNKNGPLPMPVALMLPVALVGATAIVCVILLIGYINADAGRRGMSRLAWTLLAIFVPNALGIVLYFVLRKPRIPVCPQCGAAVDPAFGFCPRCRHSLTPVCPHCRRGIKDGDKFCPYCGSDVTVAAMQALNPVTNPMS